MAVRKSARRVAPSTAPESEDAGASTTATAPAPSKAGLFANLAESKGWEVERLRDARCRGSKTVIATRGEEAIKVEWVNNVVVQPFGHYEIGAWQRKILNVAAARRLLDSPPASPKQSSKVTRHSDITRMAIDPAEFEDDELLKLLRGRTISWTNSVSGAIESAHIPRDEIEKDEIINNRFLAIKRKSDRRLLDFCSTDGGFRTVDLARVVGVA